MKRSVSGALADPSIGHRFALAYTSLEDIKLYEIKPAPGKGLGVFARYDVSREMRVMAEEPLITLSSNPEANVKPVSLFDQFKALPIEKQEQCLKLHYRQKHFYSGMEMMTDFPYSLMSKSEKSEFAKVFAILPDNVWDMSDGKSCIFLDAARINHSCRPTVERGWNSSVGQQTIHSICDIAVGDEITLSYMHCLHPRALRQQALSARDFKCACPACDPNTQFGQ